ncbi:MAG TPA: choice-of-anchor D domain-containing protein [Candidatus Eisenbacteria bacterium]|jgi:hypothetical protein
MAPEPLRTPALRLLSAMLCLVALASPAHALRFMAYNILNYPGTTGATRDPSYRVILAPLSPDVLATEEMTSQAGVNEFLGSLNTMEPGQWAAATFVDGNDTDSGLFYKPGKVQFLGQWAFYPNPANQLRLIHVYRLKPVGYSSDAAEFRVYSMHLKASMGFEAQRLAEATGLRDSLNAMPPGTHALITGDFNFYTGLEPGMQKLIESEVNNIGQLYDPLGLQNVAWQDNTSMQYAWTQSPCKTGDTGCASGASTGGLDDRFDLILPSQPFQDGAGLELVAGSYISVGNDGLHHNNSIQDPPTIPEGAAYATALHSVSDHLPVRVDLRLPAIASLSSAPIAFGTVILGATANSPLAVTNQATVPGEPLNYLYTAPAGFLAPGGTQSAAAGTTNNDAIGLDTSSPGAKSGSLGFASNSADNPSASIPLSGTVLRHASASLDSSAALTASSLDFGTHATGEFTPLDVRVHNLGYDALQARLNLTSAAITGGDGHFSVTGTTPQLLAGTGATFEVAFDDVDTSPDSVYTATLTFEGADEALPGSASAGPLSVALQAQRSGGGTTAVGPPHPTVTLLRAPVPNPLASQSVLSFDLAQGGETRLDVYDAAGRRVASLLHSGLEPGRYSVRWDGRADGGSALEAGLYFARLSAPGTRPHAVRLAIVR